MELKDHKLAEKLARQLLEDPKTKSPLRNLCECYLDAAVEPTDPRPPEPEGPRVVVMEVEVFQTRLGRQVWSQCPICSSTVDVYEDGKLRCRDMDCTWIEEALEGENWRDGMMWVKGKQVRRPRKDEG